MATGPRVKYAMQTGYCHKNTTIFRLRHPQRFLVGLHRTTILMVQPAIGPPRCQTLHDAISGGLHQKVGQITVQQGTVYAFSTSVVQEPEGDTARYTIDDETYNLKANETTTGTMNTLPVGERASFRRFNALKRTYISIFAIKKR